MEVYIGLVLTAMVGIGGLWYRVGKLTSEVKHHNLMLTEIKQAIEKFIIGR